MKAVRVIGSSPFVEEARKKRGGAGLAGRILRGAALESEFKGDEGNRVVLDEPTSTPPLETTFCTVDAREGVSVAASAVM